MLISRSRSTGVMVAGLVAGLATLVVVLLVAGPLTRGDPLDEAPAPAQRPLEGLADAMESNEAITAEPCAAPEEADLAALGLRSAAAVASVDFVAKRCRWELGDRVLEVRFGTDTSIHDETFAEQDQPRVDIAGARRAVVAADDGSESVVAIADHLYVEVALAAAPAPDGSRDVLVSTATAAVAMLDPE